MNIVKRRFRVKHFLLKNLNARMKNSQPHIPQSLGARIAHARRELGVREGVDVMVPDLAKRVGVTAASLYNWEADAAVPGEANLTRLCAVLGVTPAYLRYGVVERIDYGENISEQVIAENEARALAESRRSPPSRKVAKVARRKRAS